MEHPADIKPRSGRPPPGLRWRSSYWFTTVVVGLGIATDLLVYSSIVPVMPFQLQNLGYSNVSSLTGWLLFAYSGGLVLATIPIAMFSERSGERRIPLLMGLVILLGSQVMLMEAPNYAVMCISRILQGVGSSMVWIVGLALLCDSAPPAVVGRQLGFAMSGLSIGLLIGPPTGGALYNRFGWRGPIVFGLSSTFLDLLGRVLIIERKDALPWGVDPWTLSADGSEVEKEKATEDDNSTKSSSKPDNGADSVPLEKSPEVQETVANTTTPERKKPISLPAVFIKLSKSSRALVAIIVTLIYGLVYTSQQPTLPLYMQKNWGFDSGKVGLVFLAAIVPTLFSSPLSGWLADRHGTEFLTSGLLILAMPWWGVIIIRGPLALFIVAFVMESFLISGLVSPLSAELAAIARSIEGIGYGHVYGAFNLAYGIGSALGPIVGGQIYDHVSRGWTVLCAVALGLLAASLLLAFCFTGEKTLLRRVRESYSRSKSAPNQV